ncbi:MAG TPA: hypothetical protein VIT67_16980 [Povalibacter sp.]
MVKSICRLSAVRWLLPLAMLSVTAACAKQEDTELQWTRAALQRNPNIEVIATDELAKTFTIRDRHTGEARTVSLHEIAGAPVSTLMAQALAAPTPAQPVGSALEPARAPAAAATPAPAIVEEEPAAAAQPMAAAPSTTPTKNYTIDRSGGQLKISGPGISVVSAGPAATTADDKSASTSAEPIICEGPRMLHFDNRNIYVDGDAITVRGGCELYITNSNIVASGTAVIVHDGVVHISNSYVEGAASSFAADSQAKVFVRGSTFQGLSRRDQLAQVQDQGGNQWR